MLSLRFGLRSREYELVKVMIFRRGKASYLYNDRTDIRGSQRKPRDCKGNWQNTQPFLRMTLTTSGRFPVPKGTPGKVSWKLLKWVEEAWTLYSGFGNQVQTQRSHLSQRFVALHSVQRLVTSLAMVWIVQWAIYILDHNYYVFLEGVGNKLLTIIQ